MVNSMTKKQFVTIINELKNYDKVIDKLMEVNSSLALAVVEKYDLKDTVVKSLEYTFNLPEHPHIGSDIAWWVYETEYGTKNYSIYTDKEVIVIDTAEKLYDLITGKLK